MTEVLVAVLLLSGVALSLVGSVGLNRFPDIFARMHAATKPATLGLILVLLGSAIRVGAQGDASKLLLVVALQVITAPVGAHMVGRAAHRARTQLSPDIAFDELAEAEARTGDGDGD